MRPWLALSVVVAAIVMSAGLNAGRAHAAMFVGPVEGSDAYVAIAKDGRKIGGYVCDDGTIGRWIAYRWLHKGSAPLVAGTTGETIGSVEITGGKAAGTIEIGGQTLPFRAKRVRASEDAGLYFAIAKQEDRLLVGGWIVAPDGAQRGAVSRVNMRTLQPLPASLAPRIDPKKPVASIGEDTGVPPVVTEPQPLVVINIIAILISLLIPAVQS